MKDECASCLKHIELDMDRYLQMGNCCKDCMSKINKRVKKALKKELEDGQ